MVIKIFLNKISDTSIYHLIYRITTFGNPRMGSKVSVTSCNCKHNIGACVVSSTGTSILKEVQTHKSFHRLDHYNGFSALK